MGTDFASPDYWSARFRTETSFEWLAHTPAVIPLILDHVAQVIHLRTSNARQASSSKQQADLQDAQESGKAEVGEICILHFGCGTSSLGRDLQSAAMFAGLAGVRVTDADYVADSIHPGPHHPLVPSPSPRPSNHSQKSINPNHTSQSLINLDVMNLDQLRHSAPPGGWDLLLDKSTADAISCGGPSVLRDRGGSAVLEPIAVLCERLAQVTRPGGRWICISYSSTRFDHLRAGAGPRGRGWALISKVPVGVAQAGSSVIDGRVVYQPETNVWVYVLEAR